MTRNTRDGLFALFVLVLAIVMFALAAHFHNQDSASVDTSEYATDTGRFWLAEDCGTLHVYTDLKTGVQYLVTDAGGACALVQQDGTPWTADDWGGAEDAGA